MLTHPLVTVYNQWLYLLFLLRKHELGIDECDCVLQAIVLSHVRYALPMYFKYLTSDMVENINAIFHKPYKRHLAKKVYEIEDIAEVMQTKMFQQSKIDNHCLNHLYVLRCSDCSMT
jgi:hypothetical protein